MGVLAVLLELERHLALVLNLAQSLDDGLEVHHAAAHLPSLALLRGLALVLDVDVVDPVLVFLDILDDILAHTYRVSEVHAAAYAQRGILDHLHDLLDVGEGCSVGAVGVYCDLDARLGNLLDGVVQKLIFGHADEHVRAVTLGVCEGAVNFGLAVHVDGAEDIALDTVLRAFGLEFVHLLGRGVERQPEILYREILYAQTAEILQRLVDGEVAIGVSGHTYLEVV